MKEYGNYISFTTMTAGLMSCVILGQVLPPWAIALLWIAFIAAILNSIRTGYWKDEDPTPRQ